MQAILRQILLDMDSKDAHLNFDYLAVPSIEG